MQMLYLRHAACRSNFKQKIIMNQYQRCVSQETYQECVVFVVTPLTPKKSRWFCRSCRRAFPLVDAGRLLINCQWRFRRLCWWARLFCTSMVRHPLCLLGCKRVPNHPIPAYGRTSYIYPCELTCQRKITISLKEVHVLVVFHCHVFFFPGCNSPNLNVHHSKKHVCWLI